MTTVNQLVWRTENLPATRRFFEAIASRDFTATDTGDVVGRLSARGPELILREQEALRAGGPDLRLGVDADCADRLRDAGFEVAVDGTRAVEPGANADVWLTPWKPTPRERPATVSIRAADPAVTAAFYTALGGWVVAAAAEDVATTVRLPGGGVVLRIFPVPAGSAAPPTRVNLALVVDDIPAALAAAAALGYTPAGNAVRGPNGVVSLLSPDDPELLPYLGLAP